MSETHGIERQGIEVLKERLQRLGRSVAPSPRKTFDLLVDGILAEVKSKQLPWARLDFVGLTDNQHRALAEGERFLLFIVCNLKGPGDPEIFEIQSESLLLQKFKVECMHYLYGAQLKGLSPTRIA